MRSFRNRYRSQSGAAGLGVLAGLVSWFAFELIMINTVMWLDRQGAMPKGKLSGYEQIPWAILGLGSPIFFAFAATWIGIKVGERTDGFDGFFDSFLGIIAGGIIAVAALMIIVAGAIVIISVWIGCIIMGIVVIGAAVSRD